MSSLKSTILNKYLDQWTKRKDIFFFLFFFLFSCFEIFLIFWNFFGLKLRKKKQVKQADQTRSTINESAGWRVRLRTGQKIRMKTRGSWLVIGSVARISGRRADPSRPKRRRLSQAIKAPFLFF